MTPRLGASGGKAGEGWHGILIRSVTQIIKFPANWGSELRMFGSGQSATGGPGRHLPDSPRGESGVLSADDSLDSDPGT